MLSLDYATQNTAFFTGLSEREEQIIEAYTNSGFIQMNKLLMGDTKFRAYTNMVVELSNIILAHGTPAPERLYRGVKRKHYPNLEVGGTVQFDMFISTTEDETISKQFASGETPIIFVFENVEQLSIPASVTETMHEKEYVMQPHQKFTITDMKQDGLWTYVHLT